jgi:CHAT domain-containing protein
MRFSPLPEAHREARALLTLWSSHEKDAAGDLLLGTRAGESAFRRLAPGRRVVHVATHGFFVGGACASARGAGAEPLAPESPLLLSGLAFAGANRRDAVAPGQDDGILTAEEVATLDLSGVEWAVLSACDTGTGDVLLQEGLLGLRRAFQMAGARTVVTSLWPVDDRGTRRWMEKLYALRWRDGLDTATSVRGAMLATLAERRRKGLATDPFHWAGFVAAGDWR